MPLRAGGPQAGRAAAVARLERIYFDHYEAVLAYCLRRTSRSEASDVAAEVFAVAWRRLDDVPAGAETRPWLYGVAYRVLSHHWRSGRRYRNLIERIGTRPAPVPPGPEPQVLRSVEHQLILEAAERLSDPDREVLRLAMWEEMTHGEIAAVLETGVEAVRQRFHRAKKRLAREYVRLGGELPGYVEEGKENADED